VRSFLDWLHADTWSHRLAVPYYLLQ